MTPRNNVFMSLFEKWMKLNKLLFLILKNYCYVKYILLKIYLLQKLNMWVAKPFVCTSKFFKIQT